MSISLKDRSLISIYDYTPEEICHILDIAEDFEKNRLQNLLNGRVIASLFLRLLQEQDLVLKPQYNFLEVVLSVSAALQEQVFKKVNL